MILLRIGLGYTPYSLGKLIDWKLLSSPNNPKNSLASPYSLGKLIDWKHWEFYLGFPCGYYSLLAREINWLETLSPSLEINNHHGVLVSPYSLGKLIDWKHDRKQFSQLPTSSPCSLLAREINWLETISSGLIPSLSNSSTPYSLGKLIDWKLHWLFTNASTTLLAWSSLLAREINWLETCS